MQNGKQKTQDGNPQAQEETAQEPPQEQISFYSSENLGDWEVIPIPSL